MRYTSSVNGTIILTLSLLPFLPLIFSNILCCTTKTDPERLWGKHYYVENKYCLSYPNNTVCFTTTGNDANYSLHKTIYNGKYTTTPWCSNLNETASFLPSSTIAKLWLTGSVPERYVTRRGYFGAVGLVALIAGKDCTTSQTLPLYRDGHWMPSGPTWHEYCRKQPQVDKWHWLCGVIGEQATEIY